MIETVHETLEWSRLRAVGPAELARSSVELGQYLPALYSRVPFELKNTLLAGPEGLVHRWRLEGKTSTEDLEVGTQARIADPLWLLSRQWQVGEFQGEDAAAPATVQVELETAPLESLRNEPGGALGATPQALPTPEAAEVLAEAQDPRRSPGGWAWEAGAGLQFLALLRDAGAGALAERLRAAFAMAPARARDEMTSADRRAADELSTLSLNAAALAAALRADSRLVGRVDATEDERGALAACAETWLARLETTAWLPRDVNGWAPSRLEYGVSLAARSTGGEVLLRAEGYAGGRLDWDAFDIASRGAHGVAAAPRNARVHVRIPVPLTYAGMPADRFWAFEDGEVNFGGLQASPADLQRMMVAGFAVLYRDDWFTLPLTLPSGQLVRVKSMSVVDGMGRRHPVPSMAARDHAVNPTRPWRWFELSGDPGPAAGGSPWMLLSPALPDALEGPAIEHVQFVRDETSNLVWAIEREFEGPLGEAVSRVLAWKTAHGRSPRTPPPEGRWRYEVAPNTPGYMVPFLPERGDNGQIRLRRGRVHQGLEAASGKPVTTGAIGSILQADRPLRLYEEEIPASGVDVRRFWQLARDRDGRVWLWLGQRKRPGRPTKEPGVTFDRLARKATE